MQRKSPRIPTAHGPILSAMHGRIQGTSRRGNHESGDRRFLFLIILPLVSALLGPATALQAQCPQNINLTSWSQEGFPSHGQWTVLAGGSRVVQSLNEPPSYFVSPYELINVRITGTITVDASAWDDDIVGFVFGYRAPVGVDSSLHDFWLFDWKRRQQNFQGYFASEGYHLSQVNGRINYTFAETHRYFWNHETNPPIFVPVDSLVGTGRGWRPGQTYTFDLIYTTLRIEIRINNSLIFQRSGCFSPGRFGFYNFSQEGVTYADFAYSLIADFSMSNATICKGGTVDFTAVPSGCSTVPTNIISWDWDFGDGKTSSSINPSHTFVNPGSYPVKLKITDGNNCVDSVTRIVTVSAGPLADAGSDARLCPGNAQIIGREATGGQPPYTYAWSPASGLTSVSMAQPGAAPAVTTTYTLTVTDAMGCSNSDDVTVFVEPAPAVDAGPDLATCSAQPVSIGSPATGGTPPYTYAWDPPFGLSDPGVAQPLAHPTSETTYTVTVTDANGCRAEDEITITVHETPLASAGPDRTLCAGDSITIGDIPIGGRPPYIFSWSPPQGLSATDIAQPMASPDVSTTYTLSVTDAFGCRDTAEVTITVITLPRPVVSGLTGVCPQTTALYRSGLDASVQHRWRVEPSDAGTISSGQGSPEVTIGWDAPGSAVVILEIEAAGCRAYDTLQVLVSGALSLRINGRRTDTLGYCPGTSLVLDAGENFASYSWQPGGETTRSISVQQPGTYRVTVRDASGCTGGDTVHVVAYDPPRPVIDPPGRQTICRGDSITLRVPGSYAAVHWSTGDTTARITVFSAGSYTVTVIDDNGCTGTSPAAEITVSDPVIPEISGDTVVCLNATRTYAVRNPASGTFDWKIDPSYGSITASTGSSVSVTWGRTGITTIIVTWTDASSPCTAADTLRVRVGDGLAPTVIGEQSICAGDSVLLRVSGGPYDSYEWLRDGTPVSGGSDSTLRTAIPGTYAVRVVSGDCSGESAGHVLVQITSPAPSVVADGPLFLCPGDSLRLSVPGTYTATRWSTGATTRDIVVREAGSYFVTVDSLGCTGKSEPVVVALFAFPDTVITGPVVACLNTPNTYALPDRAGYTYAWSVSGGQLQSGSATSSVVVAWTDSTGGIVDVTVTHSSSGCSTTLRLAVSISRTLRPRLISPAEVEICRGGTAVLRAEKGYRSYRWLRNGAEVPGAQADTLVTGEEGVYVVDVTDDGGCSGSSDPVRVSVRDARTPTVRADRTELCLGETAELTAEAGFLRYDWLRDGMPTGDTARVLSVTPASGGTYRYAASITDSAGCTATSAPLTITVYPTDTPRLSEAGSEIVCDPAGTAYRYSWYLNDTLIAGQDTDRIPIARSGTYRVMITDGNGCSAWSDPLQVTARMATAVLALSCPQEIPHSIGQTVTVPLNLMTSAHLDAEGVFALDVRIRYNRSVLAPVFTTRDESTDGSDRIVTVSVRRPEFRTVGTLTDLAFVTMLGDTDCASVRIDSAWWSDGSAETRLVDALCAICVDVCREGGTRLYHAQGVLALAPNRPNPFNTTTLIEYEVIERGPTMLYVLDRIGRRVATLVDGVVQPGRYVAEFTADGLASGTYVCVLQTPSTALYRLMIHAK